MTQEERNTNLSATTRCFCFLMENMNCKII